MTSFIIGLILFSAPGFAQEADDDEKEKVEKKPKKKKTTTKTKKTKTPPSKTKKTNTNSKNSTGNDASIKTISPDKVQTPKQTHPSTTPKRRDSTRTRRTGGNKDTSTIGVPQKKKKTTTTTTRRRRTSTSGKQTSTGTAVAGIATAAVGMAALALIPTKSQTKRLACPFDKARFGLRGGSQLSQPENDAFGGGVALGYRWCNPFAVDLSYVHFGSGLNANAPIQASLQTFLFSSLVSPYVSIGGSVAYEEEEVLYGPHGGIGAQILIKNGKSVAAVSLEGRYAQYLNEGAPQESQLQGILGVDFYF